MSPTEIREVARIVVIDAAGNVLLVRYEDEISMDPEGKSPLSYWVPPGGSLRPGESYRAAAERELEEETGIKLEIGRQVWEVENSLIYRGRPINQQEKYFVGLVAAVKPDVANRTSEAIVEHRWWSLADLKESSAKFFPRGFIKRVSQVIVGADVKAGEGQSRPDGTVPREGDRPGDR